jgi:hypothetical protein
MCCVHGCLLLGKKSCLPCSCCSSMHAGSAGAVYARNGRLMTHVLHFKHGCGERGRLGMLTVCSLVWYRQMFQGYKPAGTVALLSHPASSVWVRPVKHGEHCLQ